MAVTRGKGRAVAARGVKRAYFVAVLGLVIGVDQATKFVVQETMTLYQQIQLIGDYLRLTFIYNPGAAFGVHLGAHTRSIFLVLSVVALVVLGVVYRATPAWNRARLAAIAMISGGAIGNLVDRFRSPRGVIDFIDIGVGELRWPIFNVADIGVTVGAIVLALSLWRDERRDARAR